MNEWNAIALQVMSGFFTKIIIACFLASLVGWLACSQRRRMRELHRLWLRLAPLQRAAVCSALAIWIVYGGLKPDGGTNEVDGAGSPAPMTMAARPSAGMTEEMRLLRYVEGVTTNAAPDYVRPGGAQYCSAWWELGCEDAAHRINFGDWSFPLGTADVSSVAALSRGVVAARIRDRASWITAIGAPLTVHPFDSDLWWGEGTNGSRVVTFRNFYFRGMTNDPVNAQVRLYPSGRIEVCSNDVMTTYGRIEPFDLDRDGLANAIDPHPFASDGDGYGQSENWVRANFTNLQGVAEGLTNVQQILDVGYAQWVDAQVGDGQNNGLYKFTVTFPDPPVRRTKLTVDGHPIVIETAGSWSFLCEKGREYELAVEPVSSTNFVCSAVDDVPRRRLLRQSWPERKRSMFWESPMTPSGVKTFGWDSDLWINPRSVHVESVAAFDGCTFNAYYDAPGSVRYRWLGDFGEVLSEEIDDGRFSVGEITGSTSFRVAAETATQAATGTVSIVVGESGIATLSVGMPSVIPADGTLVPVNIAFHSPEPTNGFLTVFSAINPSLGGLWRDAGKSEEVMTESYSLEDETDLVITLFVDAESASSFYQAEAVFAEASLPDETLQADRFFTAVTRIAEPINTGMVTVDGTNHIVNPCCGIRGQNAYMRVAVSPSDFPSERIRWSAVSGAASFPSGSTGTDVAVRVAGDAEVVLEVAYGDCPGSATKFTLIPTDVHEVPVYVCEVTDVDEDPIITQVQMEAMLSEVNVIYEQVGLKFSLKGAVRHVENQMWNVLGLNNVAVRADMCAYLDGMKSDTGVEIYFVKGLGAYDESSGNEDSHGIVIKKTSRWITMAHELGHACGLADIYIGGNDAYISSEHWLVSEETVPYDWGRYRPLLTQQELIGFLLMHGKGSPNRVDIPRGNVIGIKKINEIMIEEEANVGRMGMVRFPPYSL